jgi:epoxyqueuosine reductase
MLDGLTSTLRGLAEEHEAASFGIADVEPFRRELSTLCAERHSGRSGPLRFTYDDPDRSTDVTMSFPWARRLIVVGWNYLARAGGPSTTGAVIARFATRDHYEGVRRITGALEQRLRRDGFRAEVLIDDNRLVDRAAAVRSGVGWSGKSTMVLAPGDGPWMLLGSIVTDAPLAIDEPMRRGCGTCEACFPACPTGALDDRGLDARRCLSTWLQAAGSIPQWIRPHLGRRIYGCDDCLTSCPPGRRALSAESATPIELSFSSLLAMSDDQLLDRFHWWYVPRREGRYLRRNVLVAAGNAGEPDSHEAICRHMSHRSSMIRSHAVWALARGWGSEARSLLGKRSALETAPETRAEIALALLMIDHPDAHRRLLTVDEWVETNRQIRGLALLHLDTEIDGDGSELELLVLYDGVGPNPPRVPGARLNRVRIGEEKLEEGLIPVYDPERRLERMASQMREAERFRSRGAGLDQVR